MNNRIEDFFSNELKNPAFNELLKSITKYKNIQLSQVAGAFSSLVILIFYKKLSNKKGIFIATNEDEALQIYNNLDYWLEQLHLNDKIQLFYLPSSFRNFDAFSIVSSNESMRLRCSQQLINYKTSNIIITYPEAILEKIPQSKHIIDHTTKIKVGDKIDLDFLIELLLDYGYVEVDYVYEPGQFARRGAICDVFSFDADEPYRLLFNDEKLSHIKQIDVASQMSTREILSFNLMSSLDDINDDKVSFLSLVNDQIIWINNLDIILNNLEAFYYELPEEIIDEFVNFDAFAQQLNNLNKINFSESILTNKDILISFNAKPLPIFPKVLKDFYDFCKEKIENGYTIYFTSPHYPAWERMKTILDDMDIECNGEIAPFIHYLPTVFNEGFIDENTKQIIIPEHQLFKKYLKPRLLDKIQKKKVADLEEMLELQPGDYIVHVQYGVGRFAGLEQLDINGNKQEVLKLMFKDDDVLYLSIQSMHKITKYVGADANPPTLSKLGSVTWQNKKNKLKKHIKDIARELIKLYAQRKSMKGFAFQTDNYLQIELESSFEYEDTPDQLTATEEVKKDMESDYPMDRLICGDVGFGKTEIAVRAAFKAALDGKQTAILVPTTILAFQHYMTFSERLQELPVTVDFINRFRSSKEQKEILKQLAEGKIDIIIGTHRLLSGDVKFHDLGLLVIDEEQKFGVSAKEKIRQLKANVDTLYLSATPIPRTLQMSLMGARDISVLRTPPPNRQPIHTEVRTFEPNFIKNAIEQELERGGQVFFIHNKIGTIADIANLINNLVPTARVGIAHGRMKAEEIETVTMAFLQREIDVLVSTTIIESGIDMPMANTIFINDGQNFGLSDLHQLRGRVGRRNQKAFCYILIPPATFLSTVSQKRLKTIEEFSDLGSGFSVALKDLEIRGAGSIFGAEQSGFIEDVGYEMYQKVLDEALIELRQEMNMPISDKELNIPSSEITIDTDRSILIPEFYVPTSIERIKLYRELNDSTSENDLLNTIEKIKDRFGDLPSETLELIDAIRLKWLAQQLYIEKITLYKNTLTLYFSSKDFHKDKIIQKLPNILDFIQNHPKNTNMKQDTHRLILSIEPTHNFKMARKYLEEILEAPVEISFNVS
jgi:transcription-repair coupling factor (superfamily II helicase)